MTVAEMHTAVKLGLDKTSSLDIPAFEPEEITLWLNIAQDRFIKQRMTGHNSRGVGFYDDTKRISDLHELVWTEEMAANPFVGPVTKYPNTTYISLLTLSPKLFMYYISSRSQVTRTNPVITAGWVDNKLIDIEDIPRFVTTEFNSPRFKNPVCWIEDYHIYIMHDALTTDFTNAAFKFVITYIKKPLILHLTSVVWPDTDTCELDTSTHQEIVDIAVNLMIENIESPRFGTNIEKLKTQE